ncbi:MAG: TerC family protein [Planctomycetota bacterium]
MHAESIGSPLFWIGFCAFVLVMLALDLGVFHREARAVRMREAAAWCTAWVSLALLFNFGVWHYFGAERGLQFLTGYLLEEALSVDNMFVFVLIFSYFAVPAQLHHRVLFWGILGALVMRGVFIFLGAALIARWHWILYVFGAILVATGLRLFREEAHKVDPSRNPIYRLFRRFVPTVPEYHGSRFFVRADGRWKATPLLLVLVAVEATDVVFAVDSIPAIFGITSDPFIVYTSNIFAILGLRSMYFLLAGIMNRFHRLKVGLACVLIFIGVKMVAEIWITIPIWASLVVVATLIGGSVALSLLSDPAPGRGGRTPS